MTEQEIGKLIHDTAVADGMPPMLSNLIEAQSKHETANYTSNAFINNHNCFGYKHVVGAHWQDGAGIISSEGDRYAHYENIENSVHEICAWILRRQKDGKFPRDLTAIGTPTDYAVLLKQAGYFGDPLQNYINGLTHYLIS